MNTPRELNVRIRTTRRVDKPQLLGHQASVLKWRGAILKLRPTAEVHDVAPPVILK
jgi:hypothetical protein